MKNIEESLKILREAFLSLNKDLIDKIENYNKTRSFSANLFDHSWDYKNFFEVLQNGFKSITIKNIFEVMMHLYFFKGCCDFSFDINDFIKDYKFDKEKFLEEGENTAEIMLAIKMADAFIREELKKIGVNDLSFLDSSRNNYEDLKNMTNIIRYAKNKRLFISGDYEFIVSKIHKNNNVLETDFNLSLNDNIFYTNKPEQIIAMAYNVNPGIYLIANIPYGRKVESAFYLLIVTNKDTYIIDNNKHSYRDQTYRNKSDGTKGEEAWLWGRYEETYLPIEEVLEYFNNTSNSKELINKDNEFSFKQIKKISECSTEVILWVMSFVDQCIQILEDKDFETTIDKSVSLGIFDKNIVDKNINLPVQYKSNLPSLNSLSIEWDSNTVDVDDSNCGNYLVSDIRKLSLEDINIEKMPIGLTSLKQFNGHLIFEKRKQEADSLQEELDNDFKLNVKEVMNRLNLLVNNNSEFIIDRAFKNKNYPYKKYHQFSDGMKEDYKIIDSSVLYYQTEDSYTSFKSVFNEKDYARIYYNDSIAVRIGGNTTKESECKYCEEHKGKFVYALLFQDVEQVADFLTVNKYGLPLQMVKYLNNNRSQYSGNSILSDIDPIALIHNPWWVDDIDDWGDICRNWHREALFIIRFNICGFCRKKLLS